MATTNYLPDVLDTTEAERVATGFIFTEGPLWHPDGFWYFVDIRQNKLFRMRIGEAPEVVRATSGGNGTSFDLDGRLINCEGEGRRITRTNHDGSVEAIVSTFNGGRFNRPNDVICHSNGNLYFTDPDKRVPYLAREIPGPDGDGGLWDGACVYRLTPRGDLSVLAYCEYPNGLAFSPDERTMYVANTRSSKYIHALRFDGDGKLTGRSIFADMNDGDEPGIPDGLKVDVAGRVYCTGPGGIWVFSPDGAHVGIIRWPEQAVNFAFGGPDMRTLLCCAHTSVYTLRVKVPGNPHPWYRLHGIAS
ncbi:MAG TPA: SMP-30/gluconolactonase/LRE family protein [Hyphomicrobiaceae bacterium]|nr:SMP-30/gluconolactonase/LRE family protein [Hyphomicrobiaceae bacterium]